MMEVDEMENDRADRERIRVALIPAMFDLALTYQENVCAEVLHRAGYDVRVFASRHGTDPRASGSREASFPVHRARRVLRFRDTQIPFDCQIVRLIKDFDPHVALLMAPLHGLGWSWLHVLPADCRVGSFFSDIPWHREHAPVRMWLKRRMAQSVFRHSDMVFSATQQTTDLLIEWGGCALRSKLVNLGLTFDPASLRPVAELTENVVRLRESVDKLLVMTTRVTPPKALHVFFTQIEKYLRENPDDGCVIAGLGADKAGDLLRDKVRRSLVNDRVVLLPLLNIHQVAALFRFADFSVWNSASIGMYHSLACACPVVIYRGRGSAKLLIRDEVNGIGFDHYESAGQAMFKARNFAWDKGAILRSVAFADAEKVFPALVGSLYEMRRANPSQD